MVRLDTDFHTTIITLLKIHLYLILFTNSLEYAEKMIDFINETGKFQ